MVHWRRMAAAGALVVVGCAGPEPATVGAVASDMASRVGERVRVTGEVVRPSGPVRYVSIGNDYFALRDDTGTLNVWYGPGLRCPPRIGSRVSVTGRVIKPEDTSFHIFSAIDIDTESSPPLGENEVRLCSLSFEEARIHEMEGPEALKAHWRARGEPVRNVVYD